MPEEITDVNPAESSVADSDESAVSSPAKDAPADSSPAEDGDKAPSPLDVVEKALDAGETPAPDEDGKAKPQKSESQDEKGDLPDDPTDEELKGASPRARKRIESLIETREELKGQISGLEPKARQWDKIEDFRKAQRLSAEGVANAIQIAALIENQPERAFQVIEKIHQMLAQKTGTTLPEELREAVKRGEITREHAFELSKARASSQLTRQQAETETRRRQEIENDTRLQGHVRVLGEASTAWDKTKAASDPDWMLKRQEVAARAERRLKVEGFPDTADGLRKILEEEAKAVDSLIGKFRQPARALKPSPDGASPRSVAVQKAKDHYDVVSLALGS